MTSLEQTVSSDSWARIVDVFVDAMPMDKFDFKNAKLNKVGNLPYAPSDLFKLFLYGYPYGGNLQIENIVTKKIELQIKY